MELVPEECVSVSISSTTRYILSTSGRVTSSQRYKKLLQEQLGLNIAYIPVHSINSDSARIDPQEFAWALRGLPCIGGAISRDIKQTIIPFLDELDPAAREINSVNTVIREGNILKGYNTDASGFRRALLAGLRENIADVKSVVCYGYGGVTNVVVHVLKSLGKIVYLTGRREDMVRQKADELSVSVWTPDVRADMFVNAAPVTDGKLDIVPKFLDALKGCKFAFDHEMPGQMLEQYCTLNDVNLIRGIEMYLPQMEAQWSLFLERYMDVSRLPCLLQKSSL